MAVAALGNLEIGVVGRRGNTTLAHHIVVHVGAKVANDAVPVELAVEAVHFGELTLQFLKIALREASHHIETTELTLLLALYLLENDIDTLLLGIADKAACIDYGNIAERHLRVVLHLKPLNLELTDKTLGIHKILAASQGDDIN